MESIRSKLWHAINDHFHMQIRDEDDKSYAWDKGGRHISGLLFHQGLDPLVDQLRDDLGEEE